MAKQRLINTDLWTDRWIRSINPLDRLLFVYLISNSHTNISGVYELADDVMAFEVGLNIKDIYDAFLPRLAPKVYYKDGWVVIPRFPKHQNLQSPDVVKGILREFSLAPEHVQKLALKGGWGEGLGRVGGLSPTKPNLTKLISEVELPLTVEKESSDIERPKRTGKRVDQPLLEVFKIFTPTYPKNWEANVTQRNAAQRLLDERGITQIRSAVKFYYENKDIDYCPVVDTPYKLDSKWGDLFGFKEKNNL